VEPGVQGAPGTLALKATLLTYGRYKNTLARRWACICGKQQEIPRMVCHNCQIEARSQDRIGDILSLA
jgi:hypothetical protein